MDARILLAAVTIMVTAACGVQEEPVKTAPTAPARTEVVTTIDTNTEQASTGQPTTPGEVPVRLSIPELGVDAAVVPVHTKDGALDPPDDPQVVGWWAEGARPGATAGAALLTAHTVHSGGGAFDDLGELGTSDDVVVSTRTSTLEYDVERVATYSKAELAKRAADLFSQSGPGRIVLVTCDDWDGSQYLSNTVVVLRSV